LELNVSFMRTRMRVPLWTGKVFGTTGAFFATVFRCKTGFFFAWAKTCIDPATKTTVRIMGSSKGGSCRPLATALEFRTC